VTKPSQTHNLLTKAEGRAAKCACAVACFVLAVSGPSFAKKRHEDPSPKGRTITRDLSGSVSSRDGLRLRLTTELGNVQIHTQDANEVDYKVHLETDTSDPDAQGLLNDFTVSGRAVADGVLLKGYTSNEHCSGRLWITFDVAVPRNFSVDVSTEGGNIETDDLRGRTTLVTAGGNITTGMLGGPARLETGGGHIRTKDVSGDLNASTGGGHITTGSIAGNAILRTGGGHIRAGAVSGLARLETSGGNVSLEHVGGELVADTGGGQIEVGEASGLVRARTGGGGIRVVRVAGPTNLETGAGSIYLTHVDGAIRASTAAGGITAWFGPDVKLPGASELQSSDGDIVVYLPKTFPVTIDARVQLGDEHRVFVDPAFPLKVSYDEEGGGGRVIRAEGPLNGGGETLRLRTVAGNIRLMLSDTSKQIEIYKQQMEQLQKQLKLHGRLDNPGSDSTGHDDDQSPN
jgi:DUF4097 and DUF4098 domain-containing protein YvlB